MRWDGDGDGDGGGGWSFTSAGLDVLCIYIYVCVCVNLHGGLRLRTKLALEQSAQTLVFMPLRAIYSNI